MTEKDRKDILIKLLLEATLIGAEQVTLYALKLQKDREDTFIRKMFELLDSDRAAQLYVLDPQPVSDAAGAGTFVLKFHCKGCPRVGVGSYEIRPTGRIVCLGCGRGHEPKDCGLSPPEPVATAGKSGLMDGQQAAQRLYDASEGLGSWMSAALEDPICDEFRKAATDFLQALDDVRNAAKAQSKPPQPPAPPTTGERDVIESACEFADTIPDYTHLTTPACLAQCWMHFQRLVKLSRDRSGEREAVERLAKALPVCQEEGVQFGNVWFNYDKIVGWHGDDVEARQRFYRGQSGGTSGFAKKFMEWVNEARSALADYRKVKWGAN